MQGALAGVLEGRTRVFRGIPYGARPVGPLRVAPAQPASSWSGGRDATAYGPIRLQAGDGTGITRAEPLPLSEDCLSLNIWTPHDAERLPVMVFIHGGSGVSGSGAHTDGRALSEAGRVVVVTINYRLGLLAQLALPEVEQDIGVMGGNLNLRDQQLALRWVHGNIEAFGGDPDTVTLFGESAGAIFTCLHLVAPGSRGLVHRYIMQSGR